MTDDRYTAIKCLRDFFEEHDLVEYVAQIDARVAETRSALGDEGMKALNTEVRALLRRVLPLSAGAERMPCEK